MVAYFGHWHDKPNTLTTLHTASKWLEADTVLPWRRIFPSDPSLNNIANAVLSSLVNKSLLLVVLLDGLTSTGSIPS